MPAIDADAHVIESERTWEHLEESERLFKPRTVYPSEVLGKERAREYWLIDGRLQGRRDNIMVEADESAREMADIDARLKHMDELEVDIQVLFPTVFLRPVTERPEVELALARSYNRWLADIWERGQNRLRWACVLPWYSIPEAIAELRFAKQHGACAVFARYAEGGQLLNAPAFYPLYQEANDLNIPICIHASSGTVETDGLFTHAGGVPLFKLGPIGAFHTLAISEIPLLFPQLRFGFLEVSAQWIPYICHDLYRRSKKKVSWWPHGLLREKRFFVACETDDDLPGILQFAGEDNLVIGSDYGHNDTASELDALRHLKSKGEVPPRVIDKILYDNAKSLFGL